MARPGTESGARWLVPVAALFALAAVGRPAVAAERPTVAFQALLGSAQADAKLADYQWDTSPRLGWGARSFVGVGPWSAGLSAWRSTTTQTIDGSTAASVRLTSLSLVTRGRFAAWRSTECLALASVGRLHLGYQPDRVAVQPSGGEAIVVDLRPVDEWITGIGLGFERPLAARWRVGVEVERQRFGLDTAHRNGAAIETARESFAPWSARAALSFRLRNT